MAIKLEEDVFDIYYDMTRSAMAVLLATGSPGEAVHYGSQKTGIVLVHNEADYLLMISGLPEDKLIQMGYGRETQIRLSRTIGEGTRDIEQKTGCRIEQFMYFTTRQFVFIISMPSGCKTDELRSDVCQMIHQVVENSYQEILGADFADNEIVSAVTERLNGFGPPIWEQFSSTMKYVGEYRYFCKGYGIVRDKTMRMSEAPVQPARIDAILLDVETAIRNLREHYAKEQIRELFLTYLKQSRSHELCQYAADRLNRILGIRCDPLKYWFIEGFYQAVNDRLNEMIKKNRKRSAYSEEIRAAEAYLGRNYRRKLTLDDIAREIGFNKTYLCSKFRKETGMTIHEKIMDFRIQEVKRRLKKTDDKISVISASCGFSDPDYFRHCFKDHTGMTPLQYRQLSRM